MKIEDIVNKIRELVIDKEVVVLSEKKKDISINIDKYFNDEILKILNEESNFPILSEENKNGKDYKKYLDYYWIIDPLDGSLNLSRDIPLNCISVSLWKSDKPILGIIWDFNRSELFLGVNDNSLGIEKGAWRNGVSISVSNVSKKENGIVSTGFPSWRSYESKALLNFIDLIKDFKKVRLLGSAALSLAWVSCGRFDAYIEEDIRIWDVAAGVALIEAAGGDILIKAKERANFVTAIASNGQIKINNIFK